LEGCNTGDISAKLEELKSAIDNFKNHMNGNTLVLLYNKITALEAANEALPKECKVF
jgi:hypothetical protein